MLKQDLTPLQIVIDCLGFALSPGASVRMFVCVAKGLVPLFSNTCVVLRLDNKKHRTCHIACRSCDDHMA